MYHRNTYEKSQWVDSREFLSPKGKGENDADEFIKDGLYQLQGVLAGMPRQVNRKLLSAMIRRMSAAETVHIFATSETQIVAKDIYAGLIATGKQVYILKEEIGQRYTVEQLGQNEVILHLEERSGKDAEKLGVLAGCRGVDMIYLSDCLSVPFMSESDYVDFLKYVSYLIVGFTLRTVLTRLLT